MFKLALFLAQMSALILPREMALKLSMLVVRSKITPNIVAPSRQCDQKVFDNTSKMQKFQFHFTSRDNPNFFRTRFRNFTNLR
jgi:hypothetical protein